MAKQSSTLQQKCRREVAGPLADRTAKDVQILSPRAFGRWKSTTTHHAPGFWRLLRSSGIGISLTKGALQELDRSNTSERQQEPLEKPPFEGPLEDIKRFSRHGCPDLSDIKGVSSAHWTSLPVISIQQYAEIESTKMTSNPSEAQLASIRQRRKSADVAVNTSRVTESISKRSKSGRSSANHADFMKLLISNGIDRPQRTNKPANYRQLCERLAQRRASLSSSNLSEADHENFLDGVENAFDEAQVMIDVFSAIKGPKLYPSTTNRPCYNWAPLVTADLLGRLGASRSPYNVNRSLGFFRRSFLPNFLAEVKAPGGSPEIARRQATYDGAFGARAMHYLQAYGAEEIYDGSSYTLTSTYADGKLEIFAHHLTQPGGPGKRPHFHTASVGQWLLTQNVQSFRDGVAAFRNSRDLVQEFRERFIEDANRRMMLLPPEVKKRKWTDAFQRTKEILDGNIFKESSLPNIIPVTAIITH
ncbi:MAG: hypothetical protein Q9217_003088 [Psora testacea]